MNIRGKGHGGSKMNRYTISGLVGILLLGIGSLKIMGKAENIGFAWLSEREVEVVQDRGRISHVSDKILTDRKVTRLRLKDMSTITGGDCDPCYELEVYYDDCGEWIYPGCRYHLGCSMDDECGIDPVHQKIHRCKEISEGGKTECGEAQELCLRWFDCVCVSSGYEEMPKWCARQMFPKKSTYWTGRALSGDDC